MTAIKILIVNNMYITLIPIRSYASKLHWRPFLKHDKYHVCLFFHFNFRPILLVAIVVNATTLMELKGIKMAAIMGANCPVTAK